jgi:hypothetical protein
MSNESFEIRALERQLQDLEREINLKISNKRELEFEIKTLEQEKYKVEDRLRSLRPDEITLSDHALIRYIERIEGYSLDEFREKIITDRARKAIGKFPSGLITMDGFKMRVKNRKIITIIPSDTNSEQIF